MRFKSTITFAAGLIASLPVGIFAANPSTQPFSEAATFATTRPTSWPTTHPTTRPMKFPMDVMRDSGFNPPGPGFGDMQPPPSRGGRRMWGSNAFGRSQVSPEEITQALEFMAKNSPERYRAMQGLPTDMRNGAEEGTTRLFLSWKRLSETDPDLYAVIVKRITVEDNIFGLVGEINRLAGDLTSKQSDDKRALASRLRDNVGQLVDVNLQERDLRLKKLSATLKEQQAELDRDKDPSMREQLIDERVRAVMNERRGFGQGHMHGHGDIGLPPGDPPPN